MPNTQSFARSRGRAESILRDRLLTHSLFTVVCFPVSARSARPRRAGWKSRVGISSDGRNGADAGRQERSGRRMDAQLAPDAGADFGVCWPLCALLRSLSWFVLQDSTLYSFKKERVSAGTAAASDALEWIGC